VGSFHFQLRTRCEASHRSAQDLARKRLGVLWVRGEGTHHFGTGCRFRSESGVGPVPRQPPHAKSSGRVRGILESARRFQLGLLALWLGCLCCGVPVFAHTLPISFLFLVTDAEFVHVELSLNPFELVNFSELDTNKNRRLDPDELERQRESLTQSLLTNLTLRVNGKVVSAESAEFSPEADGHHATLRAHYRVKVRNATISIESNLQRITSGSHLTQVNCLRDGARMQAQLDAQSRKATFEPGAPERKAAKAAETSITKRSKL
jgi:hypothetical protein